MKQIKVLALLSLLWGGFALTSSQAQVDLTINPVGLLFGDFSVGADFNISESFSVEPTIGFATAKEDAVSLKYTAVPVNVWGKYYFNPKNGCDKFYAAAFLRFVSRSYKADGETTYAEYSQTRFGGGFGIGYKIASAKGFIFDIGFGVGRAIIDNTKYEEDGDVTEIDWPDIMFAGKFAIGYRFGGK